MKTVGTRLPAKHIVRSGTWIWPEMYMYLYNHFAQFRKDFELGKVPKKAPLFITADKAYKLHVNGQFVCRGPARGYQSHWPMDEVDVAGYLRKGHNWIAVEAYNPGVSTFQYLHQTQAGLLCEAQWGAFSLSGSGPWQMRRSPAHAVQTARLSMQLDFQEHVDARLDDRAWITSAQPPAGWKAEIFPSAALNQLAVPFGQPPHDTVEFRGIPLLEEKWVCPAAVTAHGSGSCGEGYKTWQNVSWGWVREGRSVAGWDGPETVKSRLVDGWLEIEVEPTGPGRFRSITVDLGEYSLGNLAVEVRGSAGGEILDFQHDQCLRKGHPEFVNPGGACMAALANRMILAAGSCAHEFFHPLGGRHVTLIARDVPGRLVVRLRLRTCMYPFTMQGLFDCDDAALNDIYAICRRTQRLCSMDAYVDTPWREQAQWWGDARVQARNTFYMDGDARLLVRGIRSIAGQEAPQGLTYGHAPTCSGFCVLPDFTLTWCLTVLDYWWQTGRLDLVREQWPRIKKALAYFRQPEACDDSGLLKYDPRFWLFEDWSTLPKQRIPTFLNLWYLFTLRKMGELAGLVGKRADAARLLKAADRQAVLVTGRLFDPQAMVFRPCIDDSGQLVGEPSVHDQTMALMLDLVPEAHQNMIDKVLMPYLKDEEIKGPKASSFWCTYVFDVMAARGYGRQVVDFIRKKWSPMLSTGTCWEGFKWDETSGESACHAWTAHPSSHFVNILAGITQTAVGWERIRFSPQRVEGIDRAGAVIPSPRGMIEASWQRQGTGIRAELTIPAGVQADIALPGCEKTITGPQTVVLG